jgi:hypothetical protein
MYDHDRPDCMHSVFDEACLHLYRIHAMTPVAGYELHVQTPAPPHGLPQSSKVPGLERQDFVPWRERIDDARFPGPSAGTRKHQHGIGGLKDCATAVQNVLSELRELGTTVINDRPIHGAQNAIRNIGGTWDLQEMSAGAVFHDVLPGS